MDITNTTTLDSSVPSRAELNKSKAYNYSDSILYMKNRRSNIMYEKNREILEVENDAITNRSPSKLFKAFLLQARMLQVIVYRIREYTFNERPKIIDKISSVLPSNLDIAKFHKALSTFKDIHFLKIAEYEVLPIRYKNMTIFDSLFRKEIQDFCKTKKGSILTHSPATDFLKRDLMPLANYNDAMLDTESVRDLQPSELSSMVSSLGMRNSLIQMINNDFKTFWIFLMKFNFFHKTLNMLLPKVENNMVVVNTPNCRPLTFNEYMVLYKHFSAIIKYLIDIVNLYETTFFNKIFAIQSNIASYKSIMYDVISYSNENLKTVSESFDGVVDNNINGLNQANMFVYSDSIEDISEEELKKEQDKINEEDGVCGTEDFLATLMNGKNNTTI